MHFFEFDKTLLRQVAEECVADLNPKTIEYLKLHLPYTNHHFGFGLYLRNRFSSKFPCNSDYIRDELGKHILFYIYQILFPEFGNDIEIVENLCDNPLFNAINSNYYLATGRMAPADFPVSNTLKPDKIPDCKNDDEFDREFDKWHESECRKMQNYLTPIAEKLWGYDNFLKYALSLGFQEDEINEFYAFCKYMLFKKGSFLPLEVFLVKKTDEICEPFLSHLTVHLSWFFELNYHDTALLPDFAFNSRLIAKMAVSNNGFNLELFSKFNDDFEIVKSAVKDNSISIEYASPRLQNDMTIVKTALINSRMNLIFKIPCMKPYSYRTDLVKLALRANGANIAYASTSIRDNYEMAKYALKHQRDFYPDSTFCSLSERLRNDKSLAILELQSPNPSLDGFTKELLDDDEIADYIVNHMKHKYPRTIAIMLQKMSKRIQKKYKNTIKKYDVIY